MLKMNGFIPQATEICTWKLQGFHPEFGDDVQEFMLDVPSTWKGDKGVNWILWHVISVHSGRHEMEWRTNKLVFFEVKEQFSVLSKETCFLNFTGRGSTGGVKHFLKELFSLLRCRVLLPKMQILQKVYQPKVHFKAHSCDTSHSFRRRVQWSLPIKNTCTSTSKVPNITLPKKQWKAFFHYAFGQKYCMSSSRIFQKTENWTKQTPTRYGWKHEIPEILLVSSEFHWITICRFSFRDTSQDWFLNKHVPWTGFQSRHAEAFRRPGNQSARTRD